MSYAQKDYLAIQGINGKYRIEQIGCFVTAFCNLFADFGRDVSPVALNQELADRGIYIDIDDGIRDDLDWDSITKDDSSIVVTQVVNHGKNRDAGWPSTNDAIVRFYYQSVHTGQWIFHFCKVADAAAHTIVDSWDGVTKESPYGEPTAWATYQHNVPVAPPVQVRPPRFTVVTVFEPAIQVKLNKQPTNLWGMNWDFDYMKDHPVEVHEAGEIWEVTNIVKHEDGMEYYRRSGQVDGFNVADCDPYTAPQPELKIVDSTAPASTSETPPAAPETPTVDGSESIPVTVVKDAWKKTVRLYSKPVTYVAKVSAVVKDIEGKEPDTQLVGGKNIVMAGEFTDKNGAEYYLSLKSYDAGMWYGVPQSVVRVQNILEDESIFDGLLTDDLKLEVKHAKEKKQAVIHKAGTFLGTIDRFLILIHFKKKQKL